MAIRVSKDAVPIGEMQKNPDRVIEHASRACRPVLLTRQGRGVAVMQSLADYERMQEELVFMRAVVEGLADQETGRIVSLNEARARLGLKMKR